MSRQEIAGKAPAPSGVSRFPDVPFAVFKLQPLTMTDRYLIFLGGI
jgi:hypothetical protein